MRVEATPYAAPAMPYSSGVYHLIRDDHVLYVGASVDVLCRIGAWHRAMAGKFDAWRVYPCKREDLAELELAHIRHYNPPMNKAGRTRKYIPGGVNGVSKVVREHGSPQAYLRTRPALIGSSDVHLVGIRLKGQDLCALPGFPSPAAVQERSTGNVYHWRRDEVIAWFDAREQEAAA